MTYVPIVPPTNVPPPSPRTTELAGLLTKVLDEYTKAHPAVSKAEVRAAIKMAQMATGPDSTKTAVLLSLGLGVMVLVLGIGLYLARAGGGEVLNGESARMLIMAVIIFIAVLGAAIALKARS